MKSAIISVCGLILAAGTAAGDLHETQSFGGPFNLHAPQSNAANTTLPVTFLGLGYTSSGVVIEMSVAMNPLSSLEDRKVLCTPPVGAPFVMPGPVLQLPSGVLAPGAWTFSLYDDVGQYAGGVEGTASSVNISLIDLTAPVIPCVLTDLGIQGGIRGHDGLQDNNDFIVFIDAFFNRDPIADVGSQGGIVGSDGGFGNDDFVVFITMFFVGC